jgi:hypothetical protein
MAEACVAHGSRIQGDVGVQPRTLWVAVMLCGGGTNAIEPVNMCRENRMPEALGSRQCLRVELPPFCFDDELREVETRIGLDARELRFPREGAPVETDRFIDFPQGFATAPGNVEATGPTKCVWKVMKAFFQEAQSGLDEVLVSRLEKRIGLDLDVLGLAVCASTPRVAREEFPAIDLGPSGTPVPIRATHWASGLDVCPTKDRSRRR